MRPRRVNHSRSPKSLHLTRSRPYLSAGDHDVTSRADVFAVRMIDAHVLPETPLAGVVAIGAPGTPVKAKFTNTSQIHSTQFWLEFFCTRPS